MIFINSNCMNNDIFIIIIKHLIHIIIIVFFIYKAKNIMPELMKESRKAIVIQLSFVLIYLIVNKISKCFEFEPTLSDFVFYLLFIFYFSFVYFVNKFMKKFFPKFLSLYPYDEETSFKMKYYGFFLLFLWLIIFDLYKIIIK